MLAPVIKMYVLLFKKLTKIVHVFLLNFQIRRSSYHDVIKVSELEDILDISDVQTYVINSARVVFLNERPQQRSSGPLSSSLYNCQTCSRALLNKFRFCSLGCNVSSYALLNLSFSQSEIKNARVMQFLHTYSKLTTFIHSHIWCSLRAQKRI